MIDDTHDPKRRSWVESANVAGCDFPIQNLPLCVFRTRGGARRWIGIAIGDSILDAAPWIAGESLNVYCALPASQRRDMRREWVKALEAGAPQCELFRQSECTMLLPTVAGDYTDFYASIHHATNVGKMFRPDNPLLPNYKHVPIAYHGRSSSLVVSDTAVTRPSGQLGEGNFGPTRELDYEVELGAVLGPGNELGSPISVGDTHEHIAGVCLVNDWSARDIQRWEYQPLGPFLAKNFATTVSQWLVTTEALAPFRSPAPAHDVPILPYLQEVNEGAFDITIQAWLRTASMTEPVRVSSASFKEMYWTLGQMVAHHTSNGCNLQPGDLLGSGTQSGPEAGQGGSLLELTQGGKQPLLVGGESRTFLQDGDTVILRAHAQAPGARRIGFGDCSGTVLPCPSN
jgi:fumarylacetoacetase